MKEDEIGSIIGGLVEVVKGTHDITQTKKYFDYKGVDIEASSILVCDSTIKETFSKRNSEYYEERESILHRAIRKAFQLGISHYAYLEEQKEEKAFAEEDERLQKAINTLELTDKEFFDSLLKNPCNCETKD